MSGLELSELPKAGSFKFSKVVFCLYGPFYKQRESESTEMISVVRFSLQH